MKPVITGIIGAGAISDAYLVNLTGRFTPWIKVKSVAANHLENAQRKAEKYGLNACTTEEMMNDSEIEMIINLTPLEAHENLIRDALNHGKHVYTEKTITEGYTQAEKLRRFAAGKNLYLGCAPDTFLGSSIQCAKKAIQEGMLGEVNSFSIAVNRNNDVLTSMFPFLRRKGAGILRDYVVYYLTTIAVLLGPFSQTAAMIKAPYQKRICILPQSPEYGKEIETPNESIASVLLKLDNGITGTLHDDSESYIHDRADFVIYGTKGILLLGDPNYFGDPVRFLPAIPQDFSKKPEPVILEQVNTYTENCRGLGAAEMAYAIRMNTGHRASAELACHILETIEAIEQSAAEERFVQIHTRPELPEFFTGIEQEVHGV